MTTSRAGAGGTDNEDAHPDAHDDDLILGQAQPHAPARAVPSHVPKAALDDEAATAEVDRSAPKDVWSKLLRWLRRGGRRSRTSLPAILATTITCGVSYLIAQQLLGQPYPIVAPILVWVALGTQRDRPPRRVAELGLGATLGVVVGEIFALTVGPGPLQFMMAVLIAALIGRFLDSAELFTNQIVIQVMFMVTMPAPLIYGGAVGRWAEAALGSVLAILASTFVRRDVGRRPRELGAAVLRDLARILDRIALALRTGNARAAATALDDARGMQGTLETWMDAADTAKDIVLVNPALRGRRAELIDEVNAATQTDRALRNVRVVARLTVGAVTEEGANLLISGQVQRLAAGTRLLAHAHRYNHDTTPAREVFEAISSELSPTRVEGAGWRSSMVESLLRSLVVDLLQVAGASHSEAQRHLPRR